MVPRPHTGRFDGRARQQTNGAGAAHHGRIGRNNAGAVVLGYVYATVLATANAPLGEKKETPAADANAFAFADANAPLGEIQLKRKTVTVRSECHTYQGEWIPERESLSQTLAYLRRFAPDNPAPIERFEDYTPQRQEITETMILFACDAVYRYSYAIIAAVMGSSVTSLRHCVNKRGIYIAKWGRNANGEEDLMACRAEWEHWKAKHEP